MQYHENDGPNRTPGICKTWKMKDQITGAGKCRTNSILKNNGSASSSSSSSEANWNASVCAPKLWLMARRNRTVVVPVDTCLDACIVLQIALFLRASYFHPTPDSSLSTSLLLTADVLKRGVSSFGLCEVRHFPGPAFSSPCDLVLHFPDVAISSHCFFVVRHFQVLQIQRPRD